jgi:hypothetical protein
VNDSLSGGRRCCCKATSVQRGLTVVDFPISREADQGILVQDARVIVNARDVARAYEEGPRARADIVFSWDFSERCDQSLIRRTRATNYELCEELAVLLNFGHGSSERVECEA